MNLMIHHHQKFKYFLFLLLFLGAGFSTMYPLFVVIWEESHGSGYVNLVPDTEVLSDVFFSGKPWLVLCLNATAKEPRIWKDAGREIAMGGEERPFSMGILDCEFPLPSGKTTFERFNVDSESPYPAFFVANGNKPKMVHPQYFQNPQSSTKEQASALVSFVKKGTRLLKSKSVTSTGSLQKLCLNSPKCVLVLHHGTLAPEKQDVLTFNVEEFRTVRWVRVDLSQYGMSLQNSLPKLHFRSQEEEFAEPRMIAFRTEKNKESKKKNIYAKALADTFTLKSVPKFLNGVFQKPAEGETLPEEYQMKKLSSKPKIGSKGSFSKKKAKKVKKQKPVEPPTPEESLFDEEDLDDVDLDKLFDETDTSEEAEKQQKTDTKKKPAQPVSSSSASDVDPEIEEARRKEMERRRRAQMDEEAKESGAFAHAADDDGEYDEDEEEEEESDEEEMMDLDDGDDEDNEHIEL